MIGTKPTKSTRKHTISICKQIRAKTEAYLDSELTRNEISAFETHIRTCSACQKALTHKQEFIQKLRAVGPLYKAPVELRKSIEQIIKNMPTPKRPRK